jgi:LPS-assembly lipoprotein
MMRMRRYAGFLLAVLTLTALGGCGFHLRRSAQLPAGMQRVYLTVHGGGDLQRQLAQSLKLAGSDVVDEPDPTSAQLNVPVVSFSTQALTMTGYGRISEYAVRLHLEFEAQDAAGKVLAPRQSINLSREFTYNASQTIGSGTQAEALREEMRRDAVQAIMLRLQAAALHPAAAQQAQSKAVPTGNDSDGD